MSPGKTVKRWDIYEELILKGYSKEKAAKIANSVGRKEKRKKKQRPL